MGEDTPAWIDEPATVTPAALTAMGAAMVARPVMDLPIIDGQPIPAGAMIVGVVTTEHGSFLRVRLPATNS